MPLEDKRRIFARFIEAVEDGESIKTALHIADTSWGAMGRWLADPANTTDDAEDEHGNVVAKGEPFGVRYARARVHSAEGYASKAQHEVEVADVEDWQVRKLRADLYKWRAAMANPKEYGDRKQVEVSGNVAHLHLDALRNRNTVNNLSVPSVSVKLLDAAPLDDTDASAQHEVDTP